MGATVSRKARKTEDRYRQREGLLSLKAERAAKKRLGKRRRKGYSVGLLALPGGIGALFRARGLGKDRRLREELGRLARDQDSRARRGLPVYYERS